jgi:cyanophycinase-like exopeptidase
MCKPVYLLAGGRSSIKRREQDRLIGAALKQASVENPSVAYVGAASNDNPAFRVMITRLLQAAGAGEVKLAPLCGRRADSQKAISVVESCRIIFMSGGDVEAGMEVLAENGMIDFLRDQYRNGKPFFGVSAGSIMLAKSWVRWRDPDEDSSAELFPCLGIVPVYCDTHGEEDEWGELRALTRLIPAESVTYGIPSGAALVANPNGSVRALGGEVVRFKQTGSGIRQIPVIRDSRSAIRDQHSV